MNKKLCASPDVALSWESIDWNKARDYVRKLQMRIVKAQKQGRYGKVKALQRLLVTSFYAKALAVKRVTENKGKRTSGVDKELWSTPKAKFNAIFSLKRIGYHPMPLKRIYIPKKNGKLRPLSIPTMTDRAMQTLYKFALEPIAETTADPYSYGFRPERCSQDAIEQCFCALAKKRSPKWVLEGDIRGCFDNISHEWILEHIPMDKEILKKWLKCGYIETGELFPTESGAPQGSPISPVISNMVLDGLQQILKKNFHQVGHGKNTYTPMVNLVRFADDFIITGENKGLLENKVLPIVRDFMAQRGLELSEGKTCITHIDDGFDFLGCNIRKYKGKLLIKPSKKNIKAVLDKIRNFIKNNPSMRQDILIRYLNPIIRGWVNYQRYNVSAKAFEYLDFQIYKCLWSWCKRRHPKKSGTWVAKKYFHRIGSRSWTFSVPTKSKMSNGETLFIRLIYAVDTDITRFTQVRARTNPFDECDALYFEERETAKMRMSITGRKILESVFRRQKGICPVCAQRITVDTGFTILDTKMPTKILKSMLHPNCYKGVRSNEIQFEPALYGGL